MPRPHLPSFVAVVAALACPGCNSTDGGGRRGLSEDELAAYPVQVGDLSDRPVELIDPRDVGAVLADLDGQIKLWNTAVLSTDPADQRTRRRLEEHLRLQTRRHLALLEGALSSEGRRQRAIAAAALGFTGDTRATGLLVATLEDRSTEVVDAALLGLGLLADPRTPLSPLGRALEMAPDGWTRNNAAYALKRAIEAGADAGPVRNVLRLALLDGWESVRAQVAACLYACGDRDDVPPLSDALYDEAPMVVRAAAKALRRIAQEDETVRGQVARALFEAWQERDERRFQTVLKTELALLSGRNWGDEVDRWREWAYGLP